MSESGFPRHWCVRAMYECVGGTNDEVQRRAMAWLVTNLNVLRAGAKVGVAAATSALQNSEHCVAQLSQHLIETEGAALTVIISKYGFPVHW